MLLSPGKGWLLRNTKYWSNYLLSIQLLWSVISWYFWTDRWKVCKILVSKL